MTKYKYIGEDERVFPSLGLTVKSGDVFEAPDNLIIVNVVAASASAPAAASKQPASAASDTSTGE